MSTSSTSSWLVLGECLIKSVNEIGYKAALRKGEIILAKRGSLFRFHQAEPNEDENLVVLEVLDSNGQSFPSETFCYVEIESEGGVVLPTQDYTKAAVFKIVKCRFMQLAMSLQFVHKSKDILWLRHHSWKLRVDPDKTGQSFPLDAAFHFEQPKDTKASLSNHQPEQRTSAITGSPKEQAEKRKPGRPRKDQQVEKKVRLSAPPPPIDEDETSDIVKLKRLANERDRMKSELDALKEKYESIRLKYHEVKKEHAIISERLGLVEQRE